MLLPDPFSPIIQIRDERLADKLTLFNSIGLPLEYVKATSSNCKIVPFKGSGSGKRKWTPCSFSTGRKTGLINKQSFMKIDEYFAYSFSNNLSLLWTCAARLAL